MIEQQRLDRTADVLDLAEQANAIATACAVAQVQARTQPEKVRNDDGTMTTQGLLASGLWAVPECSVCFEDIPKARMELGRIRCIGCQTTLEKRQKGY